MSYPVMMPTVGNKLAEELDDSLRKAIAKHAPMHSAHEGWAVINEELDELWDEVKAWQPTDHRIEQMRKEALHVATMAIRFIKDVCDGEGASDGK